MNPNMGMNNMGMNPNMMGMNPNMGMGMNPMMMGQGMGMPGMGMGDGMGMGFGDMQGMGGMGMGMGGMGMGMGGMGMAPGGQGKMGAGAAPPRPGGMQGAGAGGAFNKQKVCHKWNDTGNCPYGDSCKYSHGGAENRMPGGGGPAGAGKIMTPKPAGAMGMGMAMGMGDKPKGAMHKTRLCERFMETQICPYGDKCTFAHGHHELRAPGGNRLQGAGNIQNRLGGMGSMPTAGATNVTSGGKRTHEEGASMEVKRQKVSVQPPPQERLPDQGSMDLGELQKRFHQLKEEANSFAADTGHSVAMFTIGGILSDQNDSSADDFSEEAYVKSTNSSNFPRLKLAVLKYGSGGVAKQLTVRPEIVKFVCARGTKALSEMAQNAEGNINFTDE